jgi:DNA-binding transcriptional LysR family regulator
MRMHLDDLRLFSRRPKPPRQLPRGNWIDAGRGKRRPQAHRDAAGVRLIERTTRSIRSPRRANAPQPGGDVAHLDRGRATLNKGAHAVKRRIAAPTDTSLQFLCAWLGEYQAAYPRTQVVVLMGDRMHDVTREAVDIAIRYGELEDSSMVSRLMCRSERVLVASPGYVKRFGAPRSPADLAEHRCLAC